MSALIKIKPSKVLGRDSLDGVVREGLSEKRWSFELRPGYLEGTNQAKIWERMSRQKEGHLQRP